MAEAVKSDERQRHAKNTMKSTLSRCKNAHCSAVSYGVFSSAYNTETVEIVVVRVTMAVIVVMTVVVGY